MITITIPSDRDYTVIDVYNWCKTNLGPAGAGIWNYSGQYRFRFRKETDAVLFALRWS